jgi:hypothetical protein
MVYKIGSKTDVWESFGWQSDGLASDDGGVAERVFYIIHWAFYILRFRISNVKL